MKDRHSLVWLPLVAAIIGMAYTSPSPASAQDGRALFNGLCVACHTVGGGRRVGPDLEGVTERRQEDWLIAFIRSSSSVIEGGDPIATELFAEYSQTAMPDVVYSDDEILAVLEYIESGGDGGDEPDARPATAADIQLGGDLFQGIVRLDNRGPACNSCHHVRNDAVIGGGVLAAELTMVFSRRGRSGVGAILGSAPYPVMEAAYADRPITEAETFALIAFLEDADAQEAFQEPADYGIKLLQGGFGGFVVLMLLYGLLWRRRKVRSVNQAIYDRQVKSQ